MQKKLNCNTIIITTYKNCGVSVELHTLYQITEDTHVHVHVHMVLVGRAAILF